MRVIPHFQADRKSPWEARWYVGRKLKSRFFPTEKERDKFIREYNRDLQTHGKGIFEVEPALIREWQEAHAVLPHIKPMALVEHWLNTHQESEERTISAATKAYLKIMELAGRDPSYRKHCKVTLQRFARFCNDCHVREVTAAQVAAFVHETPHSPTTKRHWRRDLNTAFKWFRKQQWTDHNPVDAVPVPKVILPEPAILKIDEAEALFRANEKIDPGICGLLALGAFAGMRSSAIIRLSYDELDFKNRAILTPAAKTKKNRRHFIEGLPDNLWSWLENTPAAAFKMSPREYARRREAAFARAGLLVSKAAVSKRCVELTDSLGLNPKLGMRRLTTRARYGRRAKQCHMRGAH